MSIHRNGDSRPNYVMVTSATLLPVTVDQCLEYGRIRVYDNDVITAMIKACTAVIERRQERQLITAVWDLNMDWFPHGRDRILLRKNPVSLISSVMYFDSAGVQQTWPTTDFTATLNAEPAYIRPNPNTFYPDTEAGRDEAVTVTFFAGYGSDYASVPLDTRTWIMSSVSFLDRNRESWDTKQLHELKFIDGLLEGNTVYHF